MSSYNDCLIRCFVNWCTQLFIIRYGVLLEEYLCHHRMWWQCSIVSISHHWSYDHCCSWNFVYDRTWEWQFDRGWQSILRVYSFTDSRFQGQVECWLGMWQLHINELNWCHFDLLALFEVIEDQLTNREPKMNFDKSVLRTDNCRIPNVDRCHSNDRKYLTSCLMLKDTQMNEYTTRTIMKTKLFPNVYGKNIRFHVTDSLDESYTCLL